MSLSAESAVQDELMEYLAEKGVNSLFVKIVENLLMRKPKSPVAYIVDYLLETFPEETTEFCKRADVEAAIAKKYEGSTHNSNNGKEPGSANNIAFNVVTSDSESEDDETDYVDELPSRKPAGNAGGAGFRRVSVSAAVLDPTKKITKVVFEKSHEEKARLEKLIAGNMLCSHLDEGDISDLALALEKWPLEAGIEVITEGDRVANHFYILEKGSAEVIKNGEKLPFEYGPGDAFGELALMYNAPRAATIKSLEACDFWRLNQNSFKSIVMGAAIKKRERLTAFLASISIFGEMNSNERMVLVDALQESKYANGDQIVTQDEPGDEFFIISKGTVSVERDGKFVGKLDEGKYFGEVALLTSKRRQATVTADSDDVRVLTVHRKVFQRVLGPLADILGRNMEAYSSLLMA